MVPVNSNDVAAHLRGRIVHSPAAGAVAQSEGSPAGEQGFRALWEASELSAADFADEIARFFDLPRAALPDLLGARPLLERFSRRFVREMTIFPCADAAGAQI